MLQARMDTLFSWIYTCFLSLKYFLDLKFFTFGITIMICFFMFTWMFKKLSIKFKYDPNICLNNILWFFLSIFIFSRLFYVISKWNELKYITNPFEFFIMNDYHFSLMWAIVGFFVLLYFQLKTYKKTFIEYIDGVVISFLFVLPVGFIWALLWWQVYGRDTQLWIEILYTHPFTSVPFEVPIFPLPIVYAIVFFILFCSAYILSLFINIRWLIGYSASIAFGSIVLILDFFSGKSDILSLSFIGIHLSQLFAIIIIAIATYWLYWILKKEQKI